MKVSREKLAAQALLTGYRPEILEKVAQLLHLLATLNTHPFLKGRWALKGGTALNLFVFDVPRLSVDIDLNYVGATDRQTMLEERPKVEQAMNAVFAREGFMVTRQPGDHAGGKWRLRYESAAGEGGNLEVDLNFMLRSPLWPLVTAHSRPVGSYSVKGIPVVDLHELAGGKLATLLSRHASRDLFDTHQLLTTQQLDTQKLRIAFVTYGAMNRKDWRTVRIEDVDFDARELSDQLLPVLSRGAIERLGDPKAWAKRLVKECRTALREVLPLNKHELQFLERLLTAGDVVPSLLTDDPTLISTITSHPGILWKAENVREFVAGRKKRKPSKGS